MFSVRRLTQCVRAGRVKEVVAFLSESWPDFDFDFWVERLALSCYREFSRVPAEDYEDYAP